MTIFDVMKRLRTYIRFTIAILFICVSPYLRSEVQLDEFQGESYLSWQSLITPKQSEKLENPFEKMSSQQLDWMRDYARSVKRAAITTDSAEKANLETVIDDSKQRLAAENLDAEKLLAARNNILQQQLENLSTPNPLVVAKEWRVAGFMAPIEFDEDFKVTRFFMVPYAGACIHTPPPPPNQIIVVELNKGVELKALDQGFWVEGKIESDLITDTASYYDGQSEVNAIYKMKADKFEFFN
ncbi:DUF3299 domain-containing protein [Vibrio vulnificus]|uniref:DUF3299 domain-containing protein n=1 Tax=Vibrio vulnificus TaxID=672 RepID=UPI001CDD064F|nr:DUF3299 domain-containing protein [Vibrio vulnificus]MCA3908190.1 DUF3299 domain-containing protein [Vibrio vulnificus]